MGQLILVLIVVAVAGLFGYQFLSTQEEEKRISADAESKARVEASAPETSAEPATEDVSAGQPVAVSKAVEVVVAEESATPAPGVSVTRAQSNPPVKRASVPEPVYDVAYAKEIVGGLSRFSPPDDKLLPSDIEEINRALEELKRQGPAAVAAIEEYLAAGEDLDFSQWAAEKDLPNATLRLALTDALGQIGGYDALNAMVRMLATSTDPREITSLAEGLEGNAPGLYRTDIVDATRETLALALESDPANFRGLSHLFGVIQAYGDDAMAADLESVYRTTDSAWGKFALMAFARLPEGNGVPYLIDIANEMFADANRNAANYVMALRMLAQASRQDPQAETAFMKMVREGRLSNSDVASVAATLGGREYQLITAGSEIARKSKAATFLNGRAPETWTDAEIDQRSAVIDQLLSMDVGPEAQQALLKASERLTVWKSRPMVNGKRLTQ